MDIERAASRLRHDLKLAQLPELKLLCGLSFFDSVTSQQRARLESYVREFIPALAAAADKSDPSEFLPDETQALERLIELLKRQPGGVVSPDDINALSCLAEKIAKGRGDFPTAAIAAGSSVRITCLFVEHYPDLDLSPRGRILNLTVTASRISSTAEKDDVVVRNPVSEPDDRFLAQARDSIKAARALLLTRYSLPEKRRYRFDYAVESTGARFTGDSLGVAFAVGAIAALARTEVLRDKLSVSPLVAFSGALSSDGKLSPVDSDALKLKIHRAFHSDLTLLVIPREHLAEAQAQVLELEKQHPGRKLDLAGPETIESVASDPRLVVTERSSTAAYVARKAWKAKRSVWVEVPALLVLLAVLFYLVAPVRYMPWFDSNPASAKVNPETNSLEVFNREGQWLWGKEFPCKLIPQTIIPICDVNADGKNEVLFMPSTRDQYDRKCRLLCYSYRGQLLFERYCLKTDECAVKNVYDCGNVRSCVVGGQPIIVTQVLGDGPALAHIRIWNADGDSLGWYINTGHTGFDGAADLTGDGQEELLFQAFNNPEGSVALFALSVDSTRGMCPSYGYHLSDTGRYVHGNQAAYILFPPSDVSRIDAHTPYNHVSAVPTEVLSSGDIQIHTNEAFVDGYPIELIYTLGKNLRVKDVTLSDGFRKTRADLVRDQKLPPAADWDAYITSISDAVTYWTDSGWVTEGQLRAVENHR